MAEDNFELKQVQVRLKLSEAEPLYSPEPMNTPDKAAEVMAEALAQMDREYACVVNLDTQLRPINFNVVSVGGISSAQVDVSNVFKTAILSNATSIMLFHNHPSGNLTPSGEDMRLTKRLIEAGKIMGIPVTDHIIVGGGTGERVSLREEEPEMFKEEPLAYGPEDTVSGRREEPVHEAIVNEVTEEERERKEKKDEEEPEHHKHHKL